MAKPLLPALTGSNRPSPWPSRIIPALESSRPQSGRREYRFWLNNRSSRPSLSKSATLMPDVGLNCAGCGNARRSNFPPRFRNTDVSKQFSRVRLSPSNESKTFAKSMSENWRYIAGNLARSTTLAYRSMSSTGRCTLPRLMAYSETRDFPPLPKWTRPSG